MSTTEAIARLEAFLDAEREYHAKQLAIRHDRQETVTSFAEAQRRLREARRLLNAVHA